MITWQSLAIVGLVVLGIACCGIGAVSLFAAGMSDNYEATKAIEREGCLFGVAGLILMTLGAALRYL